MAGFSKDDTYAKVVAVIKEELPVDPAAIKPMATFADLGADSLDMMKLTIKFEETFGLEINDDDAAKMLVLDEVVNYINERRTK